VFDLHSIFQECNPGIKQDLPIQITINNGHYKYKDVDAVEIVMLTYLLFIFNNVYDIVAAKGIKMCLISVVRFIPF